MSVEPISDVRSFGGRQLRFKHSSKVLHCDMTFAVYLPAVATEKKVPVIYWLSGLTCTDENFVTKAGAQQFAAKYGVAIVAPDTSPRGEGVPDDPEGAYDFGLGAGFYVNATQAPWATHYRMYDYITAELPALIAQELPIDTANASIMGHSMGGHGALTIGLKNSQKYRSISAFSPICHPIDCPWGQKALGNYLGDNQADWLEYDSCELIKKAQCQLPILVDQGSADNFLDEQLKPHLLEESAQSADYKITIRMQEGYDHSYFFIASFIEDHIRFHSEYLNS